MGRILDLIIFFVLIVLEGGFLINLINTFINEEIRLLIFIFYKVSFINIFFCVYIDCFRLCLRIIIE